jgi:mannose-6-phosphate isomerase-like protein (cupin superfamily)
MTVAKHTLEKNPVHLGLSGSAIVQPDFDGDESWFPSYETRHNDMEGRLVTKYRLTESLGFWEMHPMGSEMAFCLSGRLTKQQEQPDGSTTSITLDEGEYTINPPGVWHTADVHHGEVTALFITSGHGTEYRPRPKENSSVAP